MPFVHLENHYVLNAIYRVARLAVLLWVAASWLIFIALKEHIGK